MRIERKKSYISFESTWHKGSQWVTVRSIRSVLPNDDVETRSTFIFLGPHNPFPCYSMISTYEVIREWFISNGWSKGNRTSRFVTYDMIDAVTGKKLIDRVQEKTYYWKAG